MIVLRSSIERLEAEVAAAPKTDAQLDPMIHPMPAVTRNKLDRLRKQLASTEESIVELDAHVSRTPARREAIAALEEREGVLRENYLGFLRKVQEAELAQSLEAAQQGARFSIAELAEPSTIPIRSRLNYLMLGVLASLALSAAIGLLLEALDPVLVTKDQIEAAGDLPVLGSAPHLA